MSDPKLRETLGKLRDKFQSIMDPELVEKFGDPFDPDDIRNTAPSERRTHDPNLSIQDELFYLALDVEVLQKMMSLLAQDYFRRRLEEHDLAQALGFGPGPGQYV